MRGIYERSGDNFKGVFTVSLVNVEVTIQREDTLYVKGFCNRYKRSVRHVHWSVMVLFHERLHTFNFGFAGSMELQESVVHQPPQEPLSG